MRRFRLNHLSQHGIDARTSITWLGWEMRADFPLIHLQAEFWYVCVCPPIFSDPGASLNGHANNSITTAFGVEHHKR